MYIIILDYNSGFIRIHNLPDNIKPNYEEDYIENTLNYNLNEISYMITDKINIDTNYV